jgi:BirA family transcriptional regulator, biotin operon repressor / biotin---[acetyl-CoA-carboxylase] ligase
MRSQASDPVDISPQFGQGCIVKVLSYQELASTNLEALRLAGQDAPSGTVVVAARQTKGRGRLDRSWESPAGGLYFSLLFRPPASSVLSLLPLVTGLAVTEALEDYRVPAVMKWPNDVRVEGKKVAGILLELEQAEGSVVVVIGVGVNLNVDLSGLSNEVRMQALSLSAYCGHGFDAFEVLGVFVQHFNRLYARFMAGDLESLREAWRQKSDTLGKRVRVQTPRGLIEGTAVDIDDQGFLQVRKVDGSLVTVSAGDCLYLR